MNGWLLTLGYLLCGLIVASTAYHLDTRFGNPHDDDAVVWVAAVPFWPVLVFAAAVACAGYGVYRIVTADWPGLATRAWKTRPHRPAATVGCMHCGAPRVDGVRTCGVGCVCGVDPRLADHLGLPTWAVQPDRKDTP